MTRQEIKPLNLNKLSSLKCGNAKNGESEVTHDVDDNKASYRHSWMIHPKVNPLNLNKLCQCVADTPKKRGIKI
jgi:hypothetical protein